MKISRELCPRMEPIPAAETHITSQISLLQCEHEQRAVSAQGSSKASLGACSGPPAALHALARDAPSRRDPGSRETYILVRREDGEQHFLKIHIKKRAKPSIDHFPQEDIQMAHRLRKRRRTSLITREMRMETKRRDRLTAARTATWTLRKKRTPERGSYLPGGLPTAHRGSRF